MRERVDLRQNDERAALRALVVARRSPRMARRGRISYCTGRPSLPFVKMRAAFEIRPPRERAFLSAHVARGSCAGASA